MAKTVKLELTLAQANALFSFALEGEAGAEDSIADGMVRHSTVRAGIRATQKLAWAIAEAEGRR